MILYFRKSIPDVQVHMDNNAAHNESSWCNIVTLNSHITVDLIYHKPKSTNVENNQIQNSLKMFSNKDRVIMGVLNYGSIR